MANFEKFEIKLDKENANVLKRQAKTYLLEPESYIKLLISQDIKQSEVKQEKR